MSTRGKRGRGRGNSVFPSSSASSSSRRSIMPNIAAAGRLVEPKVEAKIEPASPPSGARSPRGKNNNRAVRGRGGRGSRKCNGETIIRSEGVFSQGFGEGGTGRKFKHQLKGEETVIGKLEGSIGGGDDRTVKRTKSELDDEKTADVKSEGKDKTTLREQSEERNAYEEYWKSGEEMDTDEEEFEQEMQTKSFISDLKKGTEMPFVLPSNDEPQFKKLIGKSAAKATDDEKLDEKNAEMMETSLAQLEEATRERKFKDARETMERIMHDQNSGQLMLFQISPVIFQMTEQLSRQTSTNPEGQKSQITANCNSNNSPHLQKSVSSTSAVGEAATSADPKQSHCFHQMPSGVEIGKLQFLSSGRAVLNVGGKRIDISEAIPSNCYETVLRIDTDSAQRPKPSDCLPWRLDGNEAGPHPSAHFLGELHHGFILGTELDVAPDKDKGGE